MRFPARAAVFLAVAFSLPLDGHATTWRVSCSNGTISNGGSVNLNSQATPLGTLLGMPRVPPTPPVAPAPGDTIKIGGTCTEDVTITTPQLTLVNSSTNPEAVNGDGIEGQLEIVGVRGIMLLGLTLGSATGTVTFASATDRAQLYAHDGAGLTMQYSVVQNSSLFGILAAQSSTVAVLNSTVTTNGSSAQPNTTAGIRAINGSTVILAAPNSGASATEVSFSHGDGVSLFNGSTLIAQDSTTISANNDGRQILIASGSSAHITGGAVDGMSCLTCFNAIDLNGGSSLRLDGSAQILASAGSSAIFASSGSGLVTSGALIAASASSPAVPIVDAGDNSVIGLAGGNMICSNSCDASATGTAIQVDHVSALVQLSPASFGYPAGAEAIFGNGIVQLQSTIDLGLGNVSSAPGLAWTTAAAGISVSQNSSFRLEGGVAMTGKVSLAQGSNGFFNAANGGTNTVSGGVVCPFAAIPAAHVSANSGVLSPAPTLSSNFFSVAANQCLSF